MAGKDRITEQWGRGVAWSSIGASGQAFFKKKLEQKGVSLHFVSLSFQMKRA